MSSSENRSSSSHRRRPTSANVSQTGTVPEKKSLKIIGWIATSLSILMYVSYIAQIIDNVHGHKGNFLQPLIACINCSFWVVYGFLQTPKDKPIIFANLPGIFLGAITCFTSF